MSVASPEQVSTGQSSTVLLGHELPRTVMPWAPLPPTRCEPLAAYLHLRLETEYD